MTVFVIHWLGLDNGSGRQYLFWSGIFSDITIFVGAIVFLRRSNCHARWCWRVGHYPYEVDGVTHTLCRRHHPHITDNKPVTAEKIEAQHYRNHHPEPGDEDDATDPVVDAIERVGREVHEGVVVAKRLDRRLRGAGLGISPEKATPQRARTGGTR